MTLMQMPDHSEGRPQTTPIVILAGTDYTGIPVPTVVEHIHGMIHEEHGGG